MQGFNNLCLIRCYACGKSHDIDECYHVLYNFLLIRIWLKKGFSKIKYLIILRKKRNWLASNWKWQNCKIVYIIIIRNSFKIKSKVNLNTLLPNIKNATLTYHNNNIRENPKDHIVGLIQVFLNLRKEEIRS